MLYTSSQAKRASRSNINFGRLWLDSASSAVATGAAIHVCFSGKPASVNVKKSRDKLPLLFNVYFLCSLWWILHPWHFRWLFFAPPFLLTTTFFRFFFFPAFFSMFPFWSHRVAQPAKSGGSLVVWRCASQPRFASHCSTFSFSSFFLSLFLYFSVFSRSSSWKQPLVFRFLVSFLTCFQMRFFWRF